MGYYSEYVNYFGVSIDTDEDDTFIPLLENELEKNKFSGFALLLVGAFDGADSRIDPFKWVVCFKKYSKYKEDDGSSVNGDIYGVATADELTLLNDLLQRVGLGPIGAKREELTYIH